MGKVTEQLGASFESPPDDLQEASSDTMTKMRFSTIPTPLL
jgi:hypothetical protein